MNRRTKKRIQFASVGLFLLYLLFLAYFLFFAENFGRVYTEREYAYNLQLFKEIKRFWIYRKELGMAAVLTNIVGNVVCFLPFGAILPVLWARARSFWVITLLSFTFSLLVECAQLVSKVGSFDVDDIFLNMMGGILGYLLFRSCNQMRRKHYG